jgi:hypothetical protein
MDVAVHPLASHHVPSFITAPGETDVFMVVMAVVLAAGILGFGLLFFRIHTLPERMAHKSKKIQFEIVAVLGLIALFTHMHIFWIAGLLLAFIDLPDFAGSLNRIAGSTEKLAGLRPGEGIREPQPLAPAETEHREIQAEFAFNGRRNDALAAAKLVPTEGELGHA